MGWCHAGENNLRTAIIHQSIGSEHRIGVATIKKLKRLADVLAIDDLGLNLIP